MTNKHYTYQEVAITRTTVKYMILAKFKGEPDYDKIMRVGIFETTDTYPAAHIKNVTYNLN